MSELHVKVSTTASGSPLTIKIDSPDNQSGSNTSTDGVPGRNKSAEHFVSAGGGSLVRNPA